MKTKISLILLVLMCSYASLASADKIVDVPMFSFEEMGKNSGDSNKFFKIHYVSSEPIYAKNAKVIVTKGGAATVMGDQCTIYVLNGGSVTNMGKHNTVYHEKDGTVYASDAKTTKDILVSKFTGNIE